ncbi:hypothetical protein [Gordonia hongkongensis]|uniref:hypothetical protein n=1 Tax=Gordonia hongkongensis TaxID=1701090 RepID=UPI003D731C98
MFPAARYSVDSATRSCCAGIGAHVPSCDVYLGQLHDLAERITDDADRAELVDAVWAFEDALDFDPEQVATRLSAVESLVSQLVR